MLVVSAHGGPQFSKRNEFLIRHRLSMFPSTPSHSFQSKHLRTAVYRPGPGPGLLLLVIRGGVFQLGSGSKHCGAEGRRRSVSCDRAELSSMD